jgi:DNA-binding MarR family transcriptional regulator
MATEANDLVAASLQRFGLERSRLLTALARQAGISETDLAALEHLEEAGPLTQRDLGLRLALTSGAVTMLADRLEGAGWVSRRPHPTDRRYVLLDLSSRAAEQAPPGLTRYHAAIRDLAAEVPQEHCAALVAFLAGAAKAASDAVDQLRA